MSVAKDSRGRKRRLNSINVLFVWGSEAAGALP